MQNEGTIDLRRAFVYGTVSLGSSLLFVPLLLFFAFAVIAAVMHPVVAILAATVTCLAGIFAVRWRSAALAVLFFLPCAAPALGFWVYWAEPIYIPRIWEPSEFHRVAGYPDFSVAFATAVTEGREWARDPGLVGTVFARGETGTAPTRCFVSRTSPTTATVNVLTLNTSYETETVEFYRMELALADGIWHPTSIGHAIRT